MAASPCLGAHTPKEGVRSGGRESYGLFLSSGRWRLREAAADGDEVLRSFQQKRAAEEASTRQQTMWDAARRVLRSARGMLMFTVAGDEDIRRLNRTVARLEKVATGIGDFLKLKIQALFFRPPLELEEYLHARFFLPGL